MKEPAHYPEPSFNQTRLNKILITGSSYSISRIRYAALLLIAVFQASFLHAAADLHQSWKKANTFYQQKEYDSAARYFELIAASRPADPTVFYNLGNTYYRLNNIGYAVLNYERALKRKPDYKEAAENLLLAQSRIPGFIQPAQDIFFVTWWKLLTAPKSIMTWSVISLLLFIGLIGLLLYRRLNKQVYIRPQYIGALTVCWLLSLFLAVSAARSLVSDIRAVVVSGNAYLSNKNSKGLVTLPVGTTVKVLSVNEAAAYEVELADNRSGYLQKDRLVIVD
jgi:tetratricopeptide (TPR) repeat protein